jgi:nicotinate-nucleotide pyrophosphorylase (carboxylating)
VPSPASARFDLPGFDLDRFVAETLAEDLGEAGDITSAAVIPAEARFSGVMDSREAITVAGLQIAEAFFRRLDPEVRIERWSRTARGCRRVRTCCGSRAMLARC